MVEVMDLDMGQGPQIPLFLASTVVEEMEVFEELMEDGAGALAEVFMAHVLTQVPWAQSDELQMHDVLFEDELLEEDDDDLFDLF